MHVEAPRVLCLLENAMSTRYLNRVFRDKFTHRFHNEGFDQSSTVVGLDLTKKDLKVSRKCVLLVKLKILRVTTYV